MYIVHTYIIVCELCNALIDKTEIYLGFEYFFCLIQYLLEKKNKNTK